MATAALRQRVKQLQAELATLTRRENPPPKPFREWAEDYLSTSFPLLPSSFHVWLAARLDRLQQERGQRLDVLAPRGAAKTSWASFAYPLYCALHGLMPYIVLTSDTSGQAAKFLDAIKEELENNERLRRDYPTLACKGPVWRGGEIRLANGVAIEALGTGAKIRGRKHRSRRPSLIIVDDPQNLEHVTSPVLRERSWDWLNKDVCNAGDPETNIVVLGTALHREAIVCKLQTTPGWESKAFRALIEPPRRLDLWAEWENMLHDWHDEEREAKALVFYRQHKTEMDEGASVLWPESEDLYALMTLRATIGRAAFNSEKQNDPFNPELSEWPAEYFNWPGLWFTDWPAHLEIKTLALDPSKGRDAKHGDYSAYVRLGRDRNGILYLEADLRRRNSEEIVADGVEHVKAFQPDGFGIETNQFQELLVAPFLAAAQAQQVTLPIYTIENTVPKPVRIRRWGPYLCQKLVRFKSRSLGTQLLLDQLRDFPHATFDDGPDAAEVALRLAIQLFNGVI